MKRRWMQVIACLLPVAAMAQDKAMINGTVDYNTPTTIYTLYYYKGTSNKTFDSTKVKDGKFTLAVPFEGLAVSVMMYVSHSENGMQQEDMRDVKAFQIDKNGTDIHIKDTLKTAVLTNNAIEAEKARYIKYMYLAEADSAKMGFYVNGVSPLMVQVTSTPPDSTDKTAWANYQKTTAALKKLEDLVQQKLELQRKFVKANPDSYFSMSAVEDVARYGKNAGEAEKLFNTLSERLRNSAEASTVMATIKKEEAEKLNPKKEAGLEMRAGPLKTGVMAPEFTQFDVNGKPVKLSDFKGKYILIDFWASWCVPCRKENPNVMKAYNQFKDKNFTVLGIALEEKGSKNAWLAAIKKDGLTYPQVADLEQAENPVAKAYGVSGIPYNFLIDPSGRIIATNLREEGLLDKLTEVLAN